MSNKSVCRKCRREGRKLFLKGERCFSPKCSFTKRSYAPGIKATTKSAKLSDYGKQLREKQQAKAIYGLRERQFANYYLKAAKTKQATGEKLLQMLETRLDNVVYRSGFASSLAQARQMVTHGKFQINKKKVNIPSYQLKTKDKIEPIKKQHFKIIKTEVPVWLKIDRKDVCSEIAEIPSREKIGLDVDEGLIVEFYSR